MPHFLPGAETGCCPAHHYRFETPRDRVPRDIFVSSSTQRTWRPYDMGSVHTHCQRTAVMVPPDGRLLSRGSILQDARRGLGAHFWSPGPTGLPPPVPDVMSGVPTPRGVCKVPRAHLLVEPGMWAFRHRAMTRPFYPYSTTLRTRRARSEPPPGAYMLTAVPDAYVHACDVEERGTVKLPKEPSPRDYMRTRYMFEEVLIPLYVRCPRVSEVDHRVRRRSLSRRHVARMFHVPGREGGCVLDRAARAEEPRRLGRRCGWCGSAGHASERCPVSKRNRCKCRPWPMYHTARECPVKCSRLCVGAVEGRWEEKHNAPAMLCRVRCCMCGARGHGGRDCRLQRCRCGGAHLGQDCGWRPACPVEGCGMYLCPEHCRECGSSRGPLVGWRCAACLANGVPVGERASEKADRERQKRWERKQRKKGRGPEGREGDGDEGGPRGGETSNPGEEGRGRKA